MRQFVSKLGWPIIILLIFIPIVLWWVSLPLSERFGDLGETTTNIGQLLGLTGLTAFSLTMILSTRLKFLEHFFGGMNRVYIAHHQLGGIAFILLMMHPLLLVIPYLQNSLVTAAFFFIPGGDIAINFGITALLSLMALLILTYYIDVPYGLWRYTHQYLGVVFFFGGIHSLLVPSDISRDPLIRTYMLALTSVGVAGYLYKTVLGRFLVPKIPFTVSGITKVTNDVVELTLTPAGPKRLTFAPGQFIFIYFHGPHLLSEAHPFSISSSPDESGFTVTVKSLGDYTNWLRSLPLGSRAFVEGPYGRFSYRYHKNPTQIWIAGGIGITPFLSMARAIKERPLTADVYYCCKDETDAVYLDELMAITATQTTFRVFPWFSKTNGRLSAMQIQEQSGTLKGKDVYLCGPPVMMRSMKKQLREIGMSKDAIHSEEFSMQ